METGNRRQETGKTIFVLTFGLLSIVATGYWPSASGIEFENVYVRVAAKGMTSAAYFKISNSSQIADTLFGVKADFADMAHLHQSFRKNGMVGMKPVEFIIVPAKSSVVFKPGGYHVMLMNLKQDLKTGMKVKFILIFKHAGEVELSAPVK